VTLVLDNVSKSYGGAKRAVDHLNLRIEDGEFVALLGSSGCGKTSTLRMIAGFEEVTEGTIELASRRIDKLAPARRNVAMAFEAYALYPPLTVADNIGFGLGSAQGNRGKSTVDPKQRVKEVSDLLEIGPLLNRKPSGLSGGQAQRVSLARALARDADLHLLDEPMGQLEPQLRSILRGRVRALTRARGLTSVLVTHDQTEANAMADRIAVMEGGVLQQFATPDELRDRPSNLFVATFFGEPPMNALPGRIIPGGVQLDGDEPPFADLAGLELPPTGLEVVLGIRPQHLQLGEHGWPATIVSNHWLGDEAHLALDLGGRLIVAVSPQRVPARTGSTIGIHVPAEHAHLFDAASGRALVHGAHHLTNDSRRNQP
jgi:multiple sugar transport system ATP-binding protein